MPFSLDLALAFALANASAAPPPDIHTYYREGSVYVRDGSVIVIEAAVINQPVVDRVKNLLERMPAGASILLHEIPGGLSLPADRLAWEVRQLAVQVKGGCYSACATVALAGKTLELLPSDMPHRPTRLLLHGSFGATSGQWSAYGLKDVKWLTERLRVIPLAEIERALSFKSYSGAGLYIYGRSTDAPHGSSSVVYVCEKFPSNCTDLGVPDLAALNIRGNGAAVGNVPAAKSRN